MDNNNLTLPHIKTTTYPELTALCQRLRDTIIATVAKNGGHLGSNLGMVEATVMLHRVFDPPRDSILFDVGHQCYAHKLLSGRWEQFDTLRTFGGISGFPRREESEYDPFTVGHSGSALSAAVGIAEAKRMRGDDSYTVCVIGDGSFTNGMVYEAINHCAERKLKLIILLNDNEMSISRNVGALSRRLSTVRTSKRYFHFKHTVKSICAKVPVLGKPAIKAVTAIRDLFKRMVLKNTLLENMGLDYIGPLDGGDMKKMETVLQEAKTKDTVCLVHILTKKGKGYAPAEETPEKWHSVSPFSLEEASDASAASTAASAIKPARTFSALCGDILCRLAAENDRICAVTAAMKDGTGLSAFADRYPDRFFDVGIAEEHQVTFCGGLAAGGMHPFCVVYSTFAQRAYDQILLDAALQRVPMTVMLDRAGLVSGDGVTHQGIYDYALFSTVPGARIFAPETAEEMERCMRDSLSYNGLTVIRYGRGAPRDYDRSGFAAYDGFAVADFSADGIAPAATAVTFGRLTERATAAAKMLQDRGIPVRIIKLTRLHPLPMDALHSHMTGHCYVLEEAIRRGGVGEQLGVTVPTVIHAIEDGFLPHGDLDSLDEMLGFTADALAARIAEMIEQQPQERE